jgi:hypothetical protein
VYIPPESTPSSTRPAWQKGRCTTSSAAKTNWVAAYLRAHLEKWRQAVEAAQASAADPDAKILAVFDTAAQYRT